MATQNHGRSDWKSKGEEMAGQAAHTMGQATGQASAIAEKGQEMAGNAMEQAKDLGQRAMRSAGDAATFVGKKAEQGTTAVAEQMESLGKRVREAVPQTGVLGGASSTVADYLEGSGHYLKEHGLSGIGEDLTGVVRRNPIPAILACVAIGYLIARATRS